MSGARANALLLATLALPGCDLLRGEVTEEGDAPVVAPPDAAEEPEGDPRLRVRPLERAEKKLRFIGKGAEHLGWKMTALASLYSLAGAVEVPEWSPQGEGEWRETRDDDLSTAWTCEHSKEKPCAFGIHFPKPATVRAVRVHVSGALSEDPGAYARVKTLRVHTDEGWAEGRLETDFVEQYVILGEEVVTSQLTVEVTELHRGPSKVRFAELDVFGSAGEARAHSKIDVASTFTRLGDPVWKKVSGEFDPSAKARLEYLDEDGHPRLLAAGTAAYGHTGDRFLLIENVVHSKCRSHLGDYLLLDLHTRVQVPLGDLGGLPGMVFRAEDGRGFLAGYVDESETRVHGVLWDGERYERKKSPRVMKTTYHELFEEWSIAEAPLPRGGFRLDDPDESCSLATAEQYAAFEAARSKGVTDAEGGKNRKKGGSVKLGGPADRWLACSLGTKATMFLSTGEPCGKGWELAVQEGEQLVAKVGGVAKGSHARVRRRSDTEVLVEIGSADDDVVTYRVLPTEVLSLGTSTALALSPPRQCRDRCDDPFLNPRAPE